MEKEDLVMRSRMDDFELIVFTSMRLCYAKGSFFFFPFFLPPLMELVFLDYNFVATFKYFIS